MADGMLLLQCCHRRAAISKTSRHVLMQEKHTQPLSRQGVRRPTQPPPAGTCIGEAWGGVGGGVGAVEVVGRQPGLVLIRLTGLRGVGSLLFQLAGVSEGAGPSTLVALGTTRRAPCLPGKSHD